MTGGSCGHIRYGFQAVGPLSAGIDRRARPQDTPAVAKVPEHNRAAWNAASASGTCRWADPVDAATIARARSGDWSVILTPNRAVPRSWFGDIVGKRILCLASGGGQQAPVLAAAGAIVTSLDISEEQLARDREVAGREGLDICIERGDMADLSRFPTGRFEFVFNPVSTVFAQDVRPVWRECYRVLTDGGRLLAGFMNPDFFLFDHDSIEAGGPLELRHALPYSDVDTLTAEQRRARLDKGLPLEFGHSLDDLIGGQIDAGFCIAGFYEDHWDEQATPLDRFMPTSMATLALKQAGPGSDDSC